MQLVTHPGIVNGVFFFQLVDKALADIAEGSDIIGKYFEVNHHLLPAGERLVCNSCPTFTCNFFVLHFQSIISQDARRRFVRKIGAGHPDRIRLP